MTAVAGVVPHAGSGEGTGALTASRIAQLVGGTLIGDGDAVVRAIAPLDRAGAEELSFLALARYAPWFASSTAGVVLVAPDLAETPGSARARIIVARPHDALLKVLPALYVAPTRPAGIHPSATIGRGVTLGRDVSIAAQVVLGDDVHVADGATIGSQCVIGAGSRVGTGALLHSHVTVYPGATIGARVILHSGVRIGSDGFGYVQRDGQHVKIPHVGGCRIEDDVEIGANTTIDRGSIDDTVIGAGTKIDNLVQIAHNVRIGRACLILSQAGIAGSTRIEDGVVVAGQAGIAGHRVIGRGAQVGAQAGVFGDIPPGEAWSGYPARPHKEALRAQAVLFRLMPLMRRLEQLLDRPDTRTDR